jgi:hypothetical protein
MLDCAQASGNPRVGRIEWVLIPTYVLTMAVIGRQDAAPVDVRPWEGWGVVRDSGPGGGAAQVGGAVRDAAGGGGDHGGWFAGGGWFGGEGGSFGGEAGWFGRAADGDGFAGGF